MILYCKKNTSRTPARRRNVKLLEDLIKSTTDGMSCPEAYCSATWDPSILDISPDLSIACHNTSFFKPSKHMLLFWDIRSQRHFRDSSCMRMLEICKVFKVVLSFKAVNNPPATDSGMNLNSFGCFVSHTQMYSNLLPTEWKFRSNRLCRTKAK
eukprot:TRINITY_DN6789_c0_g2_i2.p2 TRINITY_DN6789_c0_g2~~TRINITY_DN6789_c0_g2_i2.p2  ORF type:complete len:154 (+),score=21.04 TRINITY_DN6789_c0_g2_i2:801-1262(+)